MLGGGSDPPQRLHHMLGGGIMPHRAAHAACSRSPLNAPSPRRGDLVSRPRLVLATAVAVGLCALLRRACAGDRRHDELSRHPHVHVVEPGAVGLKKRRHVRVAVLCEEGVDCAHVTHLIRLDEDQPDVELIEGHAAQHVRLGSLDVDRKHIDGPAVQRDAAERLRHAHTRHVPARAAATASSAAATSCGGAAAARLANSESAALAGDGDVGSLAEHTSRHERTRAFAANRLVVAFLRLEAYTLPTEAQVEEGRVGDLQRVVRADVDVQPVRPAGEEVAVQDPVLPRLREAAAVRAAQHALAPPLVSLGHAVQQRVDVVVAACEAPRLVGHELESGEGREREQHVRQRPSGECGVPRRGRGGAQRCWPRCSTGGGRTLW
mmetsp:Transcript_21260/g.69643  ORF Transcript_21260/g.69643 Transcript_21260/m.69643 type:complete len:379 (+) Transcript_21260:2533-3669(+)